MRVSINLGGGRGGRGRRNVERRVPRSHHHHHYRYRNDRRGVVVGGRSKSSSPKTGIVIGIVCILLAALCGFIGYNDYMKTKDYIVTSGYVIGYVDDWNSSSGNYLYSEIVEYTVDGKIYEVTSSSSSSTPLPYGSRVNVYYNPVDPKVSLVNQKSNNIIVFVFSGIFGVVGVFVLFSGIKQAFSGSKE